jgi:hypothetical protein
MHKQERENNKIWKVAGGLWASALLVSLSLGLASNSSAFFGQTSLNIEVAPTFTIETPSDLSADFNLSVASINAAVSQTVDVNVISTMPNGWMMQLSMASGDTYNGALINAAALPSSSSARIPSVAGTFSAPAALTQNSWGYSITDFGANNFAAIPAYGSADTIYDTTASGTFSIPIEIGVWAGYIPSGDYTNNIAILISAND